jgi:hypothetical protein
MFLPSLSAARLMRAWPERHIAPDPRVSKACSMSRNAVQKLRAIPNSTDGSMVSRIDETLSAIESAQVVTIPLAIKSGTSLEVSVTDSDYDRRFIYVHPMRD